MRFASLLAVALAVGVAGAAGAPAVTRVTVKITDTRTSLSRQTAATGTVVFAVTNVGRKPHAFSIAGWLTPSLAPGRTATLKVTFVIPGRYSYSGSSRGVLRIVALASPAPTTTTTVPTPQPLLVGTGPCASPSSTTVRLTMTDVAGAGGFTFSPNPIPCGTVTFIVFNGGQLSHGLQLIDPNGNALPPGPAVPSTQAITMTLTLGIFGQYEWRDSQGQGGQGAAIDSGNVYVQGT